MDRLICIILGAYCALTSAVAADWVPDIRDDGALFYGGVVSNPPHIAIRCIGPSRGGRNPVEVGAHETALTPIYAVRFEFSTTVIPLANGNTQRNDVIMWLDRAGYQFPAISFSELESVWSVNVGLSDPLIGAMQRATEIIVGPSAGTHHSVDASGLNEALSTATAFCVSEYARLGHPVPAALLPFAVEGSQERGGDTIADLAEAAVEQACSGGMRVEPGHILVGNIDGDLAPDAVIDWRKITCTNGHPQPFCGASTCAADVYLSRKYGLVQRPESLLALGVSLIPLNNGTQGVKVGGSLGVCNAAGRGNACDFIWYWNGSELDFIP